MIMMLIRENMLLGEYYLAYYQAVHLLAIPLEAISESAPGPSSQVGTAEASAKVDVLIGSESLSGH